MRSRLLAAVVASIAVFAGGCGGDGESAAEWADSFCMLTHDWGQQLEKVRDGIGDRSATIENLEGAATETRGATDEYVSRLDDLGAPDIGARDEIEAALDELGAEVDGEAAEIEDAVDDMTGVAAGLTAAREIRASLSAMFTALDRALTDLRQADPGGELRAGFAAATSCDRIA